MLASSEDDDPRSTAGAPDEAYLVYDGECPFCTRFVRLMRLRETVAHLRLVNFRDGGERIDALQDAGYDPDTGMILRLDGEVYHGADCVHALALLSTRSTVFNRLVYLLFKSRKASGVLYPLLRAGRNATLRVMRMVRARHRVDAEP